MGITWALWPKLGAPWVTGVISERHGHVDPDPRSILRKKRQKRGFTLDGGAGEGNAGGLGGNGASEGDAADSSQHDWGL